MNNTGEQGTGGETSALLTTQGRKLLVALATVLVSVLIAAIPELEGLHDELVSIVVVVLITALGAHRVGSILRRKKRDQVQQEEIKHLIEETVEELLETEQIMTVPPAAEEAMPFDTVEQTAQGKPEW